MYCFERDLLNFNDHFKDHIEWKFNFNDDPVSHQWASKALYVNLKEGGGGVGS